MSPERYKALDADPEGVVTEEEFAQGWHFCPDWDWLLVGPGMPEEEGCCCS